MTRMKLLKDIVSAWENGQDISVHTVDIDDSKCDSNTLDSQQQGISGADPAISKKGGEGGRGFQP